MRNKTIENLFRILILIAAFIGCEEKKIEPQINESLNESAIPVQESWNSQIIFTENGIRKAVLYSDHIRVYEESREKLLTGVKINFYDENEVVTSTLTSKKGRVDDITENMYAIDSVVAKNKEGRVLRTDELMWNNKKQKISTDDFVIIEDDKERIEGYGFESDQGLKNYTIFNITYITTTENDKEKE